MDWRIMIRRDAARCLVIDGGGAICGNLTLRFLGELFQGPLTHNPLSLMVLIEESTDRHGLLQKTWQLLRSHWGGGQDGCGAI